MTTEQEPKPLLPPSNPPKPEEEQEDYDPKPTTDKPTTETTPLLPSKAAIIRSTTIYSHFLTLLIYDYWVLGPVTRFAWRCPTPTHLLPHFRAHLGSTTHLDIGVGTGYYLANASIPTSTRITLLDLSEDSLAAAAQRFGRPETTTTVLHDVFEPLPAALGPFDSISMFYLLHCLPGSISSKCSNVFSHLHKRLSPGGCVYGATILGEGVEHNAFGRTILGYGHREGFFCNREDGKGGLEAGLAEWFDEVEVRVVGTVALFVGRGPRA